MNKFKRLAFQAFLWLVIGIIIWVNREANSYILKKNLMIFFLQISLIGSMIYYASPKLLFKKKYLLLSVYSITVLGISGWTLTFLSPLAIGNPPPVFRPEFFPSPPLKMKKPPSLFILQTSILTISYALSTLIEVFIYLKEKEKETINAKNINLQNELKLLKSQINPHFLFNALNNIYALSAIDSDKTQQSIACLSNMLRYVLYECENNLVPIVKEIKYIENYLKLVSLKSSKSYPITTKFYIDNKNTVIAPMLFIPFIENALKHGNIEKIKDTFINIKIESKNTFINFEIENSIPKTDIIKDSVGGIGLENVKKRLAILYPKTHKLDITENKSTFKVQLNLKLK